MADKTDKKQTHQSRVWEWSKSIIATVAVMLGIQKGALATAGDGNNDKVKEIPGWLLNAFPSFTREDETEFNLILDSYPSAKQVEAEFRKKFIREDYDETKYRLAMVHMRREYVERMAKTMPKNDPGTRMTFAPLEMRDSVREFFSELIVESVAGGTPEEVYRRQERMALNRHLLEKRGAAKKIGEAVSQNKIDTVLTIVAILLGILVVLAFIPFLVQNFALGRAL